MSLGGRLSYDEPSKGGSAPKKVEVEIQGKLDPATWAEFLEKFKALLKQYGLNVTQANK